MHKKVQSAKKNITIVYVSLFLAMILFSTATFSWFTAKDTATILSDSLQMNASSGLRVNEGEEISNIISLKDIHLSEVSSVDGRNMFLPLSCNYSSDTYDMIFREASVGDQNEHFAYKNFTLTGDSELTQIYLKSYNIQVTDKNGVTYKYNGGTEINYENKIPVSQVAKVECPVRIAFIQDSANKPVVIDPTALVDEHVTNYNVVEAISSAGFATCTTSDYTSFSNHYFSYNNPLFELFGSESKNVAMVVWLEGGASSTVSDKFADATISVDVELESNFSNFIDIFFVDDTIGDDDTNVKHWINPNDDCIVCMAYYDITDKTTKTVVMNPLSKTQWHTTIPSDVTTDIYFYRYSLTDEVIYNAWYTSENVNDATSSKVKNTWLPAYTNYNGLLQTDRGTAVTYTALRGNGYGDVADNDADLQKKRLSPCIGFWDYTTSGGGESGGGNTGGGGETGDTKPIVKIGLAVEGFEGDKAWISTDLRNGFSMYAVLSKDGVETREKLTTDTNDYKRVETKNLNVINGSVLKGFVLTNDSGYSKPMFAMVNEEVLDSDYNYTFHINTDNKIE